MDPLLPFITVCNTDWDQWCRNYVPAGPAAAERGHAGKKKAQNGPILKQCRARWRIGGPFLRSGGDPKFEVTPLTGTLYTYNYIGKILTPHN